MKVETVEGEISSGASGGAFTGAHKVEKAHSAAQKKSPENGKNEVKLPPPPPRCRPLMHSMKICGEFLAAKLTVDVPNGKKKGLQICHPKFTTFFALKLRLSKDIGHLVLTLRAPSHIIEAI